MPCLLSKNKNFCVELTLSVRPGRSLAISVHLFPYISCAWTIPRSSSSVHGPLLMCGSSWFLYLSRHCLPLRCCSRFPIRDHDFVPCSATSFRMRSSSCECGGASWSAQRCGCVTAKWHAEHHQAESFNTCFWRDMRTVDHPRTKDGACGSANRRQSVQEESEARGCALDVAIPKKENEGL